MSAASVRLAPALPTASPSSAARGPLGTRPGAGAGAGSFESVLQGTLAGPRTPAPGSAAAPTAPNMPTAGRVPEPTSEPTFLPTSDLTDLTAEQSDPSVAPTPGTAPPQPGTLLSPPGFSFPALPSGAGTGSETGAETGSSSGGADGETAEPSTSASAAAEPATADAVPAGAPAAPISAPPTSIAAGAAPAAAAPGPAPAPAPAPGAAAVGTVAVPAAGTAAAGLAAVARTSVAGEPVATVAPADASAPTALVVPLGTPATTAVPATAVVVPPGAPAAPPVPLAGQVSRPLFTLVGAANGDHVMTISVSPDNLGPVTVQAHVRGEHIRVELFAPTELARDALRAILPDLRRDLSVGGLNAQLTLSADARASDPSGSKQGGPDARPDRPAVDERATRSDRAAGTSADRADLRPPSLRAGVHTIDVFA